MRNTKQGVETEDGDDAPILQYIMKTMGSLQQDNEETKKQAEEFRQERDRLREEVRPIRKDFGLR